MFPREQRIRTTRDILQVLRRGSRRSSGTVACSFLAKPATLGRVTVIVDNKSAKRATRRNFLKRRARAILREVGLPAGDTVVRIFKGTEGQTYQQLRGQLRQCLPPRR